MTATLNESLIKRITLLKFSLKEAEKYLKETTNEYAFALGVSLLHDVIENLFWAISSKMEINLKETDRFSQKYDKLYAELKKKITFDKTNIVELNTIRNSFKHQGVLPNIQQTKSITNKLLKDFDDTVNIVFNLNISSISLSMLIRKDIVRTKIQELEKKIYASKNKTTLLYKEALTDLGRIYFDHYEKNYVGGFADILAEYNNKKKKKYSFVERNIDQVSRDLLELGMIPYYYYRFKNLVPSYGIDNQTSKIIQKVDSLNWGKENWTELNTEFCLNWLIDFVLRNEKLYAGEGYNIQTVSRLHIFEPKENIVLQLTNFPNIKAFDFTLIQGKRYLGYFTSFVETEWQDYDEVYDINTFFILYCKEKRFSGQITKEKLKVTEIHNDDITQEEMTFLLTEGDKARS